MSSIQLYSLDAEKYTEELVKILKNIVKDRTIIYVTTNRPYSYIVNLFVKNKIPANKILFIDCISKHVGIENKSENCIIVESPQNLTAIAIAINESAKNIVGKKCLLLDSLSSMLLYNDAGTLGKFLNFLINKMRNYDAEMIILALELDLKKDIVQRIESFADEVIKVGH